MTNFCSLAENKRIHESQETKFYRKLIKISDKFRKMCCVDKKEIKKKVNNEIN